jgi:hypothetical protein
MEFARTVSNSERHAEFLSVFFLCEQRENSAAEILCIKSKHVIKKSTAREQSTEERRDERIPLYCYYRNKKSLCVGRFTIDSSIGYCGEI